LAERAFVRTLNGGCTSPVAAYAQCQDGILTLTGLYVSPDETVIRRGTITGSATESESLGHSLAQQLKEGDI
jgi:hydroxymethylbilane synthase